MIHAREDYNRIQDPEGKIGEDEPVFLLRAKDKLAPATLRDWALKLQAADGDEAMIEAAYIHASRMERWQQEHGCKVPDLPGERRNTGPGRIVQHIDGRKGRTFNDTNIIDGKVPVYFAIEYNKQVPVKFSTTASLIDPAKLSVIGYID